MEFLLGLVLVYAVMMLGISPIIIKFTQRYNRNFTLQPIAFEALEPPMQESVRKIVFSLQTLGFTPICPFVYADFAPMVNCKFYLLYNYSNGDAAVIVTIYTRAETFNYVEFSTSYQDGININTRNAGQPVTFKTRPNKLIYDLKELKDPRTLYSAHRAILEHHANPTGTELPEPGRELPTLYFSIIRDLEDQVENGRMYYDKESTSYRFTWKGAFLATWQNIWPIKSIITSRMNSKGKQVAGLLP